jgi:hypothetical protein
MDAIIVLLFIILILLVFIAFCICCSLSYISSVLYNLEKITTDILKRMENK